MNSQKKHSGELRRKIEMRLKTVFLTLLITIFSILGTMTANAATISDDGQYTLILSCGGIDGDIDGDYGKVIRFNVADGETTVSLSELTAGVVPFNGQNKFAYWGKDWSGDTKAEDELAIADFTSTGTVWLDRYTEVNYTNGLCLYGIFSDEALKGTGTYYVTLDGFAGTINGKAKLRLTSSSGEYQTVDLSQYKPVRDGYTFVGWDLDGKLVTSVDSSCFAEKDAVAVTATYTKNTFEGDDRVLILNANGGTIAGTTSNKYDYLGGADSGTSMSLLPYTPVREGYTFTGWNTRSDGSGKNYTYMYWRLWDNDGTADVEKDTLIENELGAVYYQNVTLYASWTKNAETPSTPDKPETPTQPAQETVKEIQSTGETKATIEFADGINKDYRLDIQKVEIKKELADKNVRFIADINVLDGNTVVGISNTKMKIRIAIPEDLKGYNKYEVVYILNDEIKETIPAAVEDGYIVFETSHLSQYGIVATNDSAAAGNKTNTAAAAGNPRTGDESNITLWLAVSLVSCGVVTGCTVSCRRRRLNKR